MDKNKLVLCYLLMVLAHVGHVFEEVWARFWPMQAVYGIGWFLVINWILLCLPVAIFYFILQQKRWAYYLGLIYAGVMIVNGLGHNIVTLVTGRYFDGFAGGFTGLGLILIGLPMIYYLRQAITTR